MTKVLQMKSSMRIFQKNINYRLLTVHYSNIPIMNYLEQYRLITL